MAARRGENHIARTGGIPDRADDRTLRRTAGSGEVEQPIYFGLPLRLQAGDLGGILRANLCVVQRGGKLFQGDPRIGNNGDCSHLVGIELRGVDIHEGHIGILKRRHRGRGEVGVACADSDDEIRRVREPVGGQRACCSDGAHRLRVVPGERALPCLRLAHRNAGLRDELGECGRGFTHQHPASGNDERTTCLADGRDRALQREFVGLPPANQPHALMEELFRVVVGLCLNILRQGQRNGAAVRGRREDAHRLRQCGDELLRTVDAVPVAAHGLETIVDAGVLRAEGLQLLKHRSDLARREDVAR